MTPLGKVTVTVVSISNDNKDQIEAQGRIHRPDAEPVQVAKVALMSFIDWTQAAGWIYDLGIGMTVIDIADVADIHMRWSER